MKNSQWWDKSITLVEGCTPVSTGCLNCWAAAMTHRFHQEKQLTRNSRFIGKVICREDRLGEILKRFKPTRYTIWNDLFHEKVPFGFIDKVISVFEKCPQHTGQLLTKREKRIYKYAKYRKFEWPDNVTGMVTIENQEMADLRIPYLLQCGFKTVGVNIEPMLEKIDLEYIKDYTMPNTFAKYERIYALSGERSCLGHRMTEEKIGWVIIGCESLGNKAGRFQDGFVDAAIDIVNQCKVAKVPVFVKQIPINGKVSHEWPEDLRLRQFPEIVRAAKF